MDLNGKQMSHEISLLLFRVGTFRFCAPAKEVEAIIGMPASRSIPKAPPSIQGVFSHRGQIASVINLRKKFGLEDHKDTAEGQLILARISVGLTGFRVDEVMDITSSMEKDIIRLAALEKSTRFDQVVILGDHIIQCTDFEQLYQAEDAPSQPGPSPSPDRSQENAPSPVIEKDEGHPDGEPEQKSPAYPENNGRSDREPDEGVPLEVSDRTMPESSPAVGKIPRATEFIPGAGAGSPSKSPPHRPTPQFRLPAVNRRTAEKKSRRNIVPEKTVSQFRQEGTSMGEDIGRSFLKKRFGLAIAWMLPLAAVTIVIFLLWPASPEKPQRGPAPTVPIVSRSAESESSVSKDEDTQLSTERFPSATPNDPALKDAGALAVKTSVEPAEPLSPITADSEPQMDESSEMPRAVEAEANEKPDTPATAPVPREDESRFITVETDEFTLSIEPGLSEIAEPSSDSKETGTEAPSPSSSAPPPEREYIHIVVKGDTLWDIAEKYLGDPFRYPQLAELSHIRDPDWIYPGDRVRILLKGTTGQDDRM